MKFNYLLDNDLKEMYLYHGGKTFGYLRNQIKSLEKGKDFTQKGIIKEASEEYRLVREKNLMNPNQKLVCSNRTVIILEHGTRRLSLAIQLYGLAENIGKVFNLTQFKYLRSLIEDTKLLANELLVIDYKKLTTMYNRLIKEYQTYKNYLLYEEMLFVLITILEFTLKSKIPSIITINKLEALSKCLPDEMNILIFHFIYQYYSYIDYNSKQLTNIITKIESLGYAHNLLLSIYIHQNYNDKNYMQALSYLEILSNNPLLMDNFQFQFYYHSWMTLITSKCNPIEVLSHIEYCKELITNNSHYFRLPQFIHCRFIEGLYYYEHSMYDTAYSYIHQIVNNKQLLPIYLPYVMLVYQSAKIKRTEILSLLYSVNVSKYAFGELIQHIIYYYQMKYKYEVIGKDQIISLSTYMDRNILKYVGNNDFYLNFVYKELKDLTKHSKSRKLLNKVANKLINQH